MLATISDLQFSLTSSLGSVQAEKDLRIQLQTLQDQTDQKDKLIQTLQSQLDHKSKRVEELQEQIRWSQLDFKNQLESKEAKIESLNRSLSAKTEVNRLQAECDKLYQDIDVEDRMEGVVRRAKEPVVDNGKSKCLSWQYDNFGLQCHYWSGQIWS